MQTMPPFVYLIPAAISFGLGKVPGAIATLIFAMPSIMAGVNQTLMLALTMVVIASMTGAGGLGNTVLTGIQRLNVGLGFEGGLGVVLLAILLDRITQSFGRGKRGNPSRAPTSLLTRIRQAFAKDKPPVPKA